VWPAFAGELNSCSDITTYECWRRLSAETRTRILEAGRRFLRDCRPSAEPWLEGKDIEWDFACAYKAFMLIASREPEGLEALPDAVWSNWSSLLLASRQWSSRVEYQGLHRSLVEHATRRAPVEVLRTFRCMLGPDRLGSYGFIDGLRGCWNELLRQVALEVLRNSRTEAHVLMRLLEALLPEGWPEGQTYAESLLGEPHDESSSRQEFWRKLYAAKALLTHGPTGAWEGVWSVLSRDVEFGRRVLGVLADDSPRCDFIDRLSHEQRVEFYLWLERHGTTWRPDARWHLRSNDLPEDLDPLREGIYRSLTRELDPTALHALERLALELPERTFLRKAVLASQRHMRRWTWTPPSPQELRVLIGSPRARLVQNGNELLDAVLESLQRLEKRLHGETPAVHFLWDRRSDGTYWPKEENRLSDWIKLHLEEDLSNRRIVVNREVEIRPTEPTRSGQRTDIRVDAIARLPNGSEERLSVIIEVKGCWNRGLWTAMREQLVERYLAENTCQHGIYVVGWYECSLWHGTPLPPNGQAPDLTRARGLLEDQARALSRGGLQVRALLLDAAFRGRSPA
jgi:hypothetical protein